MFNGFLALVATNAYNVSTLDVGVFNGLYTCHSKGMIRISLTEAIFLGHVC